jgi:hypothetical protein
VGVDPISTITDMMNSNTFGHGDVSIDGNATVISAFSGASADAPGQALTVNNGGAFFNGFAPGRGQLTVGPDAIPGGTPRAQAFILLHELGHITSVLRPDLGDSGAGKANDRDIRDHCKKTLESF